MNEFKGTPGPWHWQGEILCNDDHIVGGDSWTFGDADKRLIAAAPELLDALQRCESVLSNIPLEVFDVEDLLYARASINKALGEKQ